MIIVFMGLPGSGATQIADAVKDRINGLHLDKERYTNVFSGISEMQYYYKLGILARTLEQTQDKPVIVDSVFNLEQHRQVFGKADIVIWVDTVKNLNNLAWEDPKRFDHKIDIVGDEHSDALPTRAINVVRKFNLFDWKIDTALMVNRYQPWHKTNIEDYNNASKKASQVVIGVKHVSGMTENDLLHFDQISRLISKDISNAKIIKLPNITNIVYNDNSDFDINKIGD